uniref:Hexosyltransferase n=1 Tax=Fundulus heteroclitus TaxID=8078 RepID=A0A3Q2PXS4_FUNHE
MISILSICFFFLYRPALKASIYIYIKKKKNQEKKEISLECNILSILNKCFIRQQRCCSFSTNQLIYLNRQVWLNRTPMKCHNKTFLLLAVKSSPASFERRQSVRETWGREGLYQSDRRVRLVFFLGKNPPDDPDVGALLSFEAKRFGDIVQWDFHESLLNLTLKMDLFLQWTVRNCPWVSFVFSGDDDVFVNTDALVGYLESLDAAKSSRLYVGQVLNTASPLRDPRSKYFIPQTFYSGPYPAYAGGGGFVVSGELMQSLSLVSKSFPLFPIDDVYMGLCMKALGIAPESHQGFQTFDIRKEDRENVCVHKYLLLIHQRTPRQIKKMWNGIHNPLLTC